MITLRSGEALLENRKTAGWNAYLTTDRLILYNNIGFGDDMMILDAKTSSIESVTSRMESPFPFYVLGTLFCLSAVLPSVYIVFMDRDMPFFWSIILVPFVLWAGSNFVFRRCFGHHVLSIRVKEGRTFNVPGGLKALLEKAFPIYYEPRRMPVTQKIKECLRGPNGKFDFQDMLERLLS